MKDYEQLNPILELQDLARLEARLADRQVDRPAVFASTATSQSVLEAAVARWHSEIGSDKALMWIFATAFKAERSRLHALARHAPVC